MTWFSLVTYPSTIFAVYRSAGGYWDGEMLEEEKMSEPIAPPGKIFVCCACGKTSPGLYGTGGHKLWDESCMLNAVLANGADLVKGNDGRVTRLAISKMKKAGGGQEAIRLTRMTDKRAIRHTGVRCRRHLR